MKRITYLYILLMLAVVDSHMNAQTLEQPLYPDGVGEIAAGGEWEPSISIYLPHIVSSPTGQLIVICPGGGYKGLAMNHEGHQVAEWLADRGVAAIVLRYRMPRERFEVPLQDAKAAIRMARENAEHWSVDPQKIGIMGFSAGGHLAAMASTEFTDDDRPDFSILFYPVISMNSPEMHGGSRANLLGRMPEQSLPDRFSPHVNVTSRTPPAFIVHCSDDPAVKPRNATMYYDALTAAGVSAELHIFPLGGHGWGFSGTPFPYYNDVKTLLGRWLREQDKAR